MVQTELVIAATHCWVGRGDVDYVDRLYGEVKSDGLIVPGHEVVGVVARCGSEVTHFTVGDRVGVGYQVSSCGMCEWCRAGSDQYCRAQQCLVVDRPGGFASHIWESERFVVAIPDTLPGAWQHLSRVPA